MTQSTMPLKRRTFWYGISVIVITGMTVSFLLAIYVMNGHPVDASNLSLITESSTAQDVEALLGQPTTTETHSEVISWRYTGITWCMITVVFNPDGTVESVIHDH